MAEEDLVQYKDISDLKRELEGMKGRKDISAKELYDAVQKLAQTMTGILEIFGAAAEQMNLEEKEYESSARKHDMIVSKLEKLIDQNKTIAEAMVGIVDMVKDKFVAPAKEREESFFKPKPEQRPFMRPQTEWQPRPEPMMPRAQQIMPQMAQPMPSPASPPDFGMQMPPMQPEPSPELPDLDFPEEPTGFEDEPKKKGLFGMFKK